MGLHNSGAVSHEDFKSNSQHLRSAAGENLSLNPQTEALIGLQLPTMQKCDPMLLERGLCSFICLKNVRFFKKLCTQRYVSTC